MAHEYRPLSPPGGGGEARSDWCGVFVNDFYVRGFKLPPRMNDQNGNLPRYRWPWFVLAALLLGVALAIVWMSFAVHLEKQERDVNAPLPTNPAR